MPSDRYPAPLTQALRWQVRGPFRPSDRTGSSHVPHWTRHEPEDIHQGRQRVSLPCGDGQHIVQIFDIAFCIREAEIWLRIKNDGPEAFKPHEYGKMITIYRKIKKDGSGAWQMKSKDGRVISRAKSELQEMSDHMNIQVSAPALSRSLRSITNVALPLRSTHLSTFSHKTRLVNSSQVRPQLTSMPSS